MFIFPEGSQRIYKTLITQMPQITAYYHTLHFVVVY